MSDQLEAAIEAMRQSTLALDEAEALGGAGDGMGSITAMVESMGHVRNSVIHLTGAVQTIEARLDEFTHG
jgi:hypothetical protein